MYFFSHIKHNLLNNSRTERAHCLILCHIAAASMMSFLGGSVPAGRRVQRAFSPALPPSSRRKFLGCLFHLFQKKVEKGNDERSYGDVTTDLHPRSKFLFVAKVRALFREIFLTMQVVVYYCVVVVSTTCWYFLYSLFLNMWVKFSIFAF